MIQYPKLLFSNIVLELAWTSRKVVVCSRAFAWAESKNDRATKFLSARCGADCKISS